MTHHLSTFLIFFLAFWLNSFIAMAEQKSHVHYEFYAENDKLIIKAYVEPGWKVYANHPGDIGIPFSIKLENISNLNSYKIIWPEYKTFTEIAGDEDLSINYYSDTFVLELEPISVNPENPTKFNLHMHFGLCKDICLNEKRSFQISLGDELLAKEIHPKTSKQKTDKQNFLQIIIFACFGGLILNFMPCVLPVLGIKILSLTKSRESKWVSLATSMGILVSFTSIGLITIIFKFMGEQIGWGLQFQNEFFLLALVILLLAMASNYYGDYEIALPKKFSNVANLHLKNEYLNSFLSGVISVILATPCTAPFLSTALAFALAGSYTEIFITFFFIGAGMASPFLLILAVPKVLKALPKPGPWMLKIKKIFALFFIATAAWLLSIMYIKVGIYWIIGFLLIAFALRSYLLKAKRRTKINAFFALITLSFLSLYLLEDKTPATATESTHWENFSLERLNKAIADDKIVIVNVTAKWCLTCKLNELKVLDDKEVISQLKEKNVIMLKADYTFKDHNIHEFIKRYHRSGIPLTVLYGPSNKKGIVLNELLDKKSLLDALEFTNSLEIAE
ncbi:MAG: thiol:disulfide interchange protein [Candidatus Midichloriaceae bacterium]|jgi:suppressor for copper-sensitivity B|nr:thiol:disulfide interchange protein [Candidatus Midichloriaceae bacterium]